MEAKILTWEEFREDCMTDAQLWYDQGYRSSNLTLEDIMNEYPYEYFDELTDEDISEDNLDYSLESYFTPKDFAECTMGYIKELEEQS